MPFLERLFLKAADVTDVIHKTYGMPDLTSSGADLVSYARLKTIPELVTFSDATGDHIDLWDGQCLEIYREKGRNAVITGLIANARRILFWSAF